MAEKDRERQTGRVEKVVIEAESSVARSVGVPV
jgi:hypothetical protein